MQKPRSSVLALRCLTLLGFVSVLACGACNNDSSSGSSGGAGTPPPPPMLSSAKPGACTNPGTDTDAVSAPFFSKTIGAYCIDPQAEIRTYGEKGKLTMDEVCTTAFDGDCETYKRFNLKRVVSLRYTDGAGKGGTVDVILSQFADVDGAYGMYTFRVVAGDPADKTAPRALDAGASGAIGTGRAYVWRGVYLAELQYNNEQESPDALAKSSDAILTQVGKDLGGKLPGDTNKPRSASALPSANMITNGIQYFPKEPLGLANVGAGAVGYYQDGDKRWRVLAIAPNDADQAKDVMKTVRGRPGSIPVAGVGDEAVHMVVQASKDSPKVEYLVARKGALIYGVGDEEYLLMKAQTPEKQAAARLTKDEATAKLKSYFEAKPALGAPSSSASSAPSHS